MKKSFRRWILGFTSFVVAIFCGYEAIADEFIIFEKQFSDSKFKEDVVEFFRACRSQDYATIFEFADVTYSRNITFKAFRRAIKGWRIDRVKILNSKKHGDFGYLIVEYYDRYRMLSGRSIEVMFWRKTANGYRFLNVPFHLSNCLEYTETPQFFRDD